MPAKDKGEVGGSHPGSQLATGSFFCSRLCPICATSASKPALRWLQGLPASLPSECVSSVHLPANRELQIASHSQVSKLPSIGRTLPQRRNPLTGENRDSRDGAPLRGFREKLSGGIQ